MAQPCLPQTRSAITVVRMESLPAFLSEIRDDASSIRHQEVRWSTDTVTDIAGHNVNFETLIVGCITERDEQPTLIELRQLCGSTAGDQRTEEIRAEEHVAATIAALETVTCESRLDLRHGQFTLEPSPMLPTQEDMLHAFCPTFRSLGGNTYHPWTDAWGVGLECVRCDGLRSYLYLEPAVEQDDGRACVFAHLGTGGDPTEDVLQHTYDPFDPVQLTRVYTVVTANGKRNWTADDSDHARQQHDEAHGGEPGERVEDVYLTRTATQTAALAALQIDGDTPEEEILDGLMCLVQRLSCDHPESPYIQVVEALRHVKEARCAATT